jgi:holliday junction DNA helicase RuvA
MISRIKGELVLRDLERVEVMTPGGVAYEVFIPTTVFERLPRLGEQVTLRTWHVVREDAQMLFGFWSASSSPACSARRASVRGWRWG